MPKAGIHVLYFAVVGEFFLVAPHFLESLLRGLLLVLRQELAFFQFGFKGDSMKERGFFGLGGGDEHEVVGSWDVFLDESGNPDVVFGVFPS